MVEQLIWHIDCFLYVNRHGNGKAKALRYIKKRLGMFF